MWTECASASLLALALCVHVGIGLYLWQWVRSPTLLAHGKTVRHFMELTPRLTRF